MISTPSVEASLDRFVERTLTHQLQKQGHLPRQPYDPQWPSECYQGTTEPGLASPWRPVRQQAPSDLFERISNALEQKLHPDIISYYSRYWSDPLPARREEGRLSLLQLWNPEDGERLRANLIGHALNQIRRRQPLTLFFACVDDEDLFISLDNNDGSIWLEAPGKKPLRQLDTSLASFLDSLQPDIIPDQE